MPAEKFRNKYRITSTRLQQWDYRWDGAYFITICTKDREHFFGEIQNQKMHLSHAGIIADILWHEIKNHAENLFLGAHVVIPNHVHGILILDGNNANNNDRDNANGGDNTNDRDNACVVSTNTGIIGKQRFQNPGKNSISSIVGSYKSAVSRHAHRLGFAFEWQPRFYDHIIRDAKSFDTITNYIINNPVNWKEDKFYEPLSDSAQ